MIIHYTSIYGNQRHEIVRYRRSLFVGAKVVTFHGTSHLGNKITVELEQKDIIALADLMTGRKGI